MVAERGLPLHIAALLGCSTGAYALALAGITALQSAADAAVVRERAPIAADLDSIVASHDRLERSLAELSDAYDRTAAAYAELGVSFEHLESGLDSVAAMAASISKTASSTPTRLSLPSVRTATRRAAPPPASHATTGASGA